MVNAPLVEGVLNARLVGSSREHDGWVEEKAQLVMTWTAVMKLTLH